MLELGVYRVHSGRRWDHPSSMRESSSPAGVSLDAPLGIGSRGPFMPLQQLWRTADKISQAIPVPDAYHLNDA